MIILGLKRKLLAITLALLPSVSACFACANDPPVDILFNGVHPDFPLKKYAGGNLGIIQPGWAKSYLVVSYLYLTDRKLDANEQASIAKAWQSKLQDYNQWADSRLEKAIGEYGELRGKVISKNDQSKPSPYGQGASYQFHETFQVNAFEVATKTLRQMIATFGAGSVEVKEWVQAQDIIFSLNERKPNAKSDQVLLPLTSQNALAKANRAYQAAALLFYQQDYNKAEAGFRAVAEDGASPWKEICQYMVARCLVEQALNCEDKFKLGKLLGALDAQIKLVPEKYAADAEGLQRAVFYRSKSKDDALRFLAESVLNEKSFDFARDLFDLCYLFDQQPDSASVQSQPPAPPPSTIGIDLLDFISTIQQRDGNNLWGVYDDKQLAAMNKQNGIHALERYGATHSLPWLVAALSTNDLMKPEMGEVIQKAKEIKADSPAYLTVSFYLIDNLIRNHQADAARVRLNALLARADLNPTSRNLFKCQAMAVSETSDQYLKNAIQRSVERTNLEDSAELYKDYPRWESSDSYFTTDTAFDNEVAVDLNLKMPQTRWLKLALDSTISPDLRKLLIRSTFVRSMILQDQSAMTKLSPQLAESFPFLRSDLSRVTAASDDVSRKFALACLTLRNFGMTPYITGGVERNGLAINQFDYYQGNYWLPVDNTPHGTGDAVDRSPWTYGVSFLGNNRIAAMKNNYYSAGISRLLSTDERAAAELEKKKLLDNPPAKFFGDAIFAYAKSKPTDPAVPEMLYHLVKLPKWSGVTAVSSSYSKKAYFELHKNYPKNSWTQKAVCYY